MPTRLIPTRIADDVFEFKVPTPWAAQTLAAHIRSLQIGEDVVAGLNSVSISIHPERIEDAKQHLADLHVPVESPEVNKTTIGISIRYGGADGPDLDFVCDQLGLSQDAFINMHTRQSHRVDTIGFTPGFAYISGLSAEYAVPRLSNPRSRVAAGSVGVSAGFTGIYALAGPGGWPLIGKTEATLFDAEAEQPFALQPGLSVRFVQI